MVHLQGITPIVKSCNKAFLIQEKELDYGLVTILRETYYPIKSTSLPLPFKYYLTTNSYTMKGLLKRLSATIAKFVFAQYNPKIEAMQDETIKAAILPLLGWSKDILNILTDADPNDEKQLKAQIKLILDQSPDKLLAWAKIAIEQKQFDQAKKLLMLELITSLIEEVKKELD